MSKSSGLIWPYSIAVAIILVFGACVATIFVAVTLPVEKSDTYMMSYQDADAKANKLIEAQIAFDESYTVEYVNHGLKLENSVIEYSIKDVNGNNFDNASFKVVITRPNNHKDDQELLNPKVQNGTYTFENVTIPLEGRWNVMAQIKIDDLYRYHNVKVDTRHKKVKEY